jgi:hypothetical protein
MNIVVGFNDADSSFAGGVNVVFDEKSHLLSRILANKWRKLVQTPVIGIRLRVFMQSLHAAVKLELRFEEHLLRERSIPSQEY